MEEIKTVGYLKYQGESVQNGLLDIRKAANALIGFDEALRFFLYQENPILNEIEFEIPVKIEKGSWVALIPENFDNIVIVKGVLAYLTSKYVGTALGEMAKNDFKDIGLKNIFKTAFKSITWTLKLATHLKSMRNSKFENLQFKENNEIIGVPNDNGDYLFVPKKDLDSYIKCPEYLFSKIVSLVEDDRELEIGIADSEDLVKINKGLKEIFIRPDDEDDKILFPEFTQGLYIELQGYVTRGNENTNTIGFQYSGHILTCKPLKGSIVNHKTELFSNCTIKGYIDRTDKFGNFIEKKPRINFTELIIKPYENIKYHELFD